VHLGHPESLLRLVARTPPRQHPKGRRRRCLALRATGARLLAGVDTDARWQANGGSRDRFTCQGCSWSARIADVGIRIESQVPVAVGVGFVCFETVTVTKASLSVRVGIVPISGETGISQSAATARCVGSVNCNATLSWSSDHGNGTTAIAAIVTAPGESRRRERSPMAGGQARPCALPLGGFLRRASEEEQD
jgi:hypothetical protein